MKVKRKHGEGMKGRELVNETMGGRWRQNDLRSNNNLNNLQTNLNFNNLNIKTNMRGEEGDKREENDTEESYKEEKKGSRKR